LRNLLETLGRKDEKARLEWFHGNILSGWKLSESIGGL